MFFILRLLLILLLLFSGRSTVVDGVAFLAPKTAVQQIERLPIWEILKVLELDRFPVLKGAKIVSTTNYEDGARSVLIETEGKQNAGLVEKGLGILQREFLPRAANFTLNQFELLFNDAENLIGIFPARDFLLKNPYPGRWSYFDLSPYYFNLRNGLTAESKKRWGAFATQWEKDQRAIQAFLRSHNISEEKLISTEHGVDWYEKVYPAKRPFVYIEVSKNEKDSNKHFLIQEFFPTEFFDLDLKENPEKNQIILPVFPTVYSPAKYAKADEDYYKGIYYSIANEFELNKGDSVLLLGPGSGVDTWLAWLKTQTTIHAAGINPFEVANVKITAQIANISLVVIQHDNILNKKGQIIFSFKKFQKFLWNTPAFNSIKKRKPVYTLEKLWDHHFYPPDLNRFLKGLSRKLVSKGKALLWSSWIASLLFREESRFSVWPENQLEHQNVFVLTKKENLSIYDPTGCDSSL